MSIDVEKIKIAIDTGELQKAKDMLDGLEKQGQKTDKTVKGLGSSFFSLGTAIASVSVYQMAQNFIKTADAMNLLDSRLKLATKSTEEYISQQSKLTTIAKSSFTSISDTVTLYTKLNPALKQLGATTEQVNTVVSTFQKGLQLGGASAQESSSAILQFAQAMGSGVLRGEEFNAMAEASPKLMEYMAKGMGVPQTALRKMAENGELTASKVSNALLKMTKEIDDGFKVLPVTVGKAMTNLTTDISLFVRELDKASGASQTMANGILGISNYLSGLSTEEMANLVKLVENGAIAFGVSAVAITGAKGAMQLYTMATAEGTIATNLLRGAMNTIPFIAIATGVTLLATSFLNASKSAETLTKTLATAKDELAKMSSNQLNYRESLLEEEAIKQRLEAANAKAILAKSSSSKEDKANAELTIQSFNDTLTKLREIKSIRAKQSEENEANAKKDNGAIKSQVIDFDKLDSSLQKLVDPIRQVREQYAKMRTTLTESGNATPMALSNLAKAEAEAIDSISKKALKSSDDLKKKQEEISKAYEDIAKDGMTDYDKKIYEIAIKTKDFIQLTGDVTTGLDQQKQAVQKLNEEEDKKNLEKRNSAIDKELKSTKELFDLKEKQLGLIDDENIKNQELSTLYNARQKKEIQALYDKGEITKDYYDSSMQFEDDLLTKNLMRYSQTGQIIESVSSGMKSTMMDFMDYTSSGFKNLKKLALDLGNMIYKAVTQQMIVNPLVNALSSAATSYFSPAASVGSATASNNATLGISGADSNIQAGLPSALLHAKGGVYGNNSLGSYTNGVYSSPQVFAFAKGGTPNIGVFGEAGTEGIFPLGRNSNGELGVKAVDTNTNSNNGVVKVEVINQTSGEVQVTNTSTRNDLEGTVLSIVIGGIQNNKMGLRTMLGR